MNSFPPFFISPYFVYIFVYFYPYAIQFPSKAEARQPKAHLLLFIILSRERFFFFFFKKIKMKSLIATSAFQTPALCMELADHRPYP